MGARVLRCLNILKNETNDRKGVKMLEFLKIFGLTILGIIAFIIVALLGIHILLMIWPIVILALPIALIIYVFNLYLIAKPRKKTKRTKNG